MSEHFSISIVQDEYAPNPRDAFDNLSRFYCPSSSRYISGGTTDLEISELYDSDNLRREIRALKRAGAVVVEFENPHIGTCYAVITREQVINEYGDDSRTSLYHARQCAKGEIEEWLHFVNDEVYGYVITNDETGEEVSSCWGYYGYDYCMEEAKSISEYHEKKLAEENEQINRRLREVAR